MRKFECNDCIQNCKIELKNNVDYKPYWCVYNCKTNWHEVKEEKETKEEVKEEVPILGNEDRKVPILGNLCKQNPNLENVPLWLLKELEDELRWAIDKHPEFQTDPFQAMCIIHEELGEATQALNDFKHHGKGDMNKVIEELEHTIVTCLRTLMAINEKEKY